MFWLNNLFPFVVIIHPISVSGYEWHNVCHITVTARTQGDSGLACADCDLNEPVRNETVYEWVMNLVANTKENTLPLFSLRIYKNLFNILLLTYIINNSYRSSEIVFDNCICSIACISSAVVTLCDCYMTGECQHMQLMPCRYWLTKVQKQKCKLIRNLNMMNSCVLGARQTM